MNLAFLEYDILDGSIKANSDIGVVCVTSGMNKSELVTQLRNVAEQLETQSSDIFILQ